MDMGLPSDERATLQALVDAAAPEPLPADQAIALLQRLGDLDSEALGRLAYHALTGVAPGDGEPAAPSDILPGFPPFAAEVLMRAICGPDHRRPTSQAILIVLDTVPASSWPTAGRPHVSLEVATAIDEVVPVESVVVPEPVVEPVPEPVVEPEVEPADAEISPEHAVDSPAPVATVDEPLGHDDAFRRMLTPSREIPRFDPLSDPWEPEPEPGEAPTAAAAAEPELTIVPEPEPLPLPEPEPEPEPLPLPEPEPEPFPEPERIAHQDAPPAETGMHAEFRNLVPASFEVPRFEKLEGADDLAALTDESSQHRSGRRRRRSSRSRRKGTWLLLLAVLVLVALAVVYALSERTEETPDDVVPQGASRVMAQPVDTRS